MESASVAATHEHEHHGPPEAHASSRIDRQTLGILLFIVSEVMLFGSFFAAYFFIRVVANVGPWPPDGLTLPKTVALVNTFILVSSSFTVHWALESIRRGNRRGLILGLAATFMLGATFLFIQINEYIHIGFAPYTNAFGSWSLACSFLKPPVTTSSRSTAGVTCCRSTNGVAAWSACPATNGVVTPRPASGSTRARICVGDAKNRAWRGHFARDPKKHLGVEVPGIYWHFVDVMWIIVFTTVYIL